MVEHVTAATRPMRRSWAAAPPAERRPSRWCARPSSRYCVEPSDGSPIAGKRWPLRYAARRIAWHALDHAWEIEDRSDPG